MCFAGLLGVLVDFLGVLALVAVEEVEDRV